MIKSELSKFNWEEPLNSLLSKRGQKPPIVYDFKSILQLERV